jgi:hypothetical protein
VHRGTRPKPTVFEYHGSIRRREGSQMNPTLPDIFEQLFGVVSQQEMKTNPKIIKRMELIKKKLLQLKYSSLAIQVHGVRK